MNETPRCGRTVLLAADLVVVGSVNRLEGTALTVERLDVQMGGGAVHPFRDSAELVGVRIHRAAGFYFRYLGSNNLEEGLEVQFQSLPGVYGSPADWFRASPVVVVAGYRFGLGAGFATGRPRDRVEDMNKVFGATGFRHVHRPAFAVAQQLRSSSRNSRGVGTFTPAREPFG